MRVPMPSSDGRHAGREALHGRVEALDVLLRGAEHRRKRRRRHVALLDLDEHRQHVIGDGVFDASEAALHRAVDGAEQEQRHDHRHEARDARREGAADVAHERAHLGDERIGRHPLLARRARDLADDAVEAHHREAEADEHEQAGHVARRADALGVVGVRREAQQVEAPVVATRYAAAICCTASRTSGEP